MKREVRLSVRELVEFIMRSGSIDTRFGGFDRAQEGSRIHRMLQKEAGKDYEAEVIFTDARDYGGFTFFISGRADGVFMRDGDYYIDEIKTTARDFERLEEDDRPVHWAQAKCYAYFYACQKNLDFIKVQLTYYQVESKEIKRFVKGFSRITLEKFYTGLLDDYLKWAILQDKWQLKRNEALRTMQFPWPAYRRGQREMAVAIYNAIRSQQDIFCQAPTGIGKTLSAAFPSLKAMGEGYGEKIFYLTAKAMTRTEVEKNFDKLREAGGCFRRITLTAKDSICFLEKTACNPEACPYADGYYDRINEVLYGLLEKDSRDFSRTSIEDIAKQYMLCPFELGLDLSEWCDVVIGDYNYLFDPKASLRRYFDNEGGDYVFLIDEAHNLSDRGREMYSAQIDKTDYLGIKKQIASKDKAIWRPLSKINQYLVDLRKNSPGGRSWFREDALDELNELLRYFCYGCENWLKANVGHPVAEGVLEIYFKTRAYLDISELYDNHYVTQVSVAKKNVVVRQICLDPSRLLRQKTKLGRSAAFFSATLTPINYFIRLYGGNTKTPRYCLPSPFDPASLGILLADTISTRYADRDKSYEPIALMIKAFVSSQEGNCLVYFPSYAYMEAVYAAYREISDRKPLVQKRDMDNTERDFFLQAFQQTEQPEVGFCVLGGIYGEGIDLKGDKLIGTVIVGVGLPQLSEERDMLRNYYEQMDGCGFAYAYQYPGMNKVLQAMGRVIRDEADCGMVLLIDDRFIKQDYRQLFPAHLSHYKRVSNAEDIAKAVKSFWKNKKQ